jgi:hypothetical protein
MNDVSENFADRLNRIQHGRRGRRSGMGFVVHPDGIVTSIGGGSSRLRFGFPLKGLLTALVIAVAVKAYLMWFLGTDIYTLEVQRLLAGSAFERLAAIVLMPDTLTGWVVERYEDIYVFVQAGFAATTPA